MSPKVAVTEATSYLLYISIMLLLQSQSFILETRLNHFATNFQLHK